MSVKVSKSSKTCDLIAFLKKICHYFNSISIYLFLSIIHEHLACLLLVGFRPVLYENCPDKLLRNSNKKDLCRQVLHMLKRWICPRGNTFLSPREHVYSRFCRCVAAAEAVSSGWTSSCLCSACSETRRGSPSGSGRSSPPAAPSSERPVSGWRCNRSAVCGAASRWALSVLWWSSRTACGRGSGDAEGGGPKLGLSRRKMQKLR